MFSLLAILTWPCGPTLPPVVAVVSVLAGDGVFATARPRVGRRTTDHITLGQSLRPTATPQPAVKNYWGMPSLGVEFEFSGRPLRDVWDARGPRTAFPADFCTARGQFNYYVGWIGGQ